MAGGAARAIRQRLESLAAAGVTDLPRVRGRVGGAAPAGGDASSPARARADAAAEPSAESVAAMATAGDRAVLLDAIRQEVAACRRCEPLACSRHTTVFGAGPATARLCFLGEAPGADEDATGLPFVGRAGQLLTKIIEACRLSRDDVYILNVLKCRPPDNRQPLPDEIAACREYFERQLAAIAPEFICCLGTTAAQALLRTDEPIGRLRERWFSYGAAQVICTYHPSYLLRNPAAKRQVWDDMKRLLDRMGIVL